MKKKRFCFPRSHRINKPAGYQYVFGKPIKSSDRYFTVLARANKLGLSRLGLAISKKNIKKAIDRNRLKRSIRESFRLQQFSFTRLDFVVIAHRDAASADRQFIQKSLLRHWRTLAGQIINANALTSNSVPPGIGIN